MIYTCTSNPSLDYYVTLDKVNPGVSNRSQMELYDAGGKGVNVSIVLNNFQIPNTALGFLGGFTKDFYLSILAKYPFIQPLFTSIKDNTRINVKIMDGSMETGINAKGPHISDAEFEKFNNRLSKIYEKDYFVLSGNIEDEIKDRIISVIHELASEGVRIILDTDSDVIDKCLDTNPYLVKINRYYLNDTGMQIDQALNKMIESGAQNALYSSAKEDSYLYTAEKKYHCESLDGSLVNTTGSSDSMVAGFIYGAIRGADAKEKFTYANAASLATTLSNDLCSKDKVEEIYDQIKVVEF